MTHQSYYGCEFKGEYKALVKDFNKPPFTIIKDRKNYNKIIFTGRINNITVVDIDTYKDNKPNLYWAKFIEQYGEPDTYTVKTKNKGYHYYFKYDPDIQSSINHYPINIDIFNDDSNSNPKWVVGAGTKFEAGIYKVHNDTKVKKMPEWLKNEIMTYGKIDYREHIFDKVYNLTRPEIKMIITKLLNQDISYCVEYKKWFMVTDILKGLDYKSLWKSFCNCAENIIEVNKTHNNVIWNNIVPCRSINEITSVIGMDAIKYTKNYTPITNLYDINKQTVEMRYIDIGCVVNLGWFINTVIMKSDTGTGKTTTTFKYFKKCNHDHILSIVSRRSLVDQHIKNAKDNDIIMHSYEEKDVHKKKIVCYQLDSICRFIDNIESADRVRVINEYVIYLDEINSTIKYLLQSTTMDKKRIAIFSGLCQIIRHCKLLICSDADVSDLVFKFISSIRTANMTVFIDNEYKNYTDICATEYADIDGIIKKLKARINRNEGFICCFDQLKFLTQIYGLIYDDTKKNNFLRISSEHRRFTNTDIWKGKFVFYSPSIIYGNDFVPDMPTDVFVFVKGGTIDPLQIVQQATRCRKIKKLYYYIDAKNAWLKYKSLEDCTDQINLAYTKLRSDNTKYDENLIKSRLTDKLYNEMFDYNVYINDILCSDYQYHINCILHNKGFNIEKVGEKSRLSKSDKQIGEQLNEDEYQVHLKAYLDGSLQYQEPEVFEKWEHRREILCINKDEMYLDIITKNKLFVGHINLCRLFKTEGALKSEEAENMIRNNIGSDYTKIKLIDKLNTLLGLKRFDLTIDPLRLDEAINDWTDDDSKNYNSITKHKNKHDNIYSSLYKILVSLYKSMDRDIIDIKRKKKGKGTQYRVAFIDQEVLKFHIDLYNLRQQSNKNTHIDILNMCPDVCDIDMFID